MFSGKTEELIRRLRRAAIARKHVEVFKPTLDDRFSQTEIVSHSLMRIHAQVIEDAREIYTRCSSACDVVGIDEANFIGPKLVDVAQFLAGRGKRVIIAGLDTDYLGRPFPPIPELLACAESVVKLLAICVRCGSPAKNTQRLRGSAELLMVGAAEAYEARCRHCFEPAPPSQA